MIGEPPRTQYDWTFRLFDFPVRVHWFFWIVTAVLGLNAGSPRGVAIWIGVVFVSILVHELGHAFAMRYFGEGARIVLHSFGGLAISESNYGGYRERSAKEQILISLAGPFAGFALAALVAVILFATARYYDMFLLGQVVRIGYGANIVETNPFGPGFTARSFIVSDLLMVNIYWGILNLMPIYPLDGGQISRELFLAKSHNGAEQSLKLSMGTAIAVAALALWSGSFYMAVMFAFLAYSNYQMLYPGYGGFGRPW